jgi:peptidoglycan/LPS O-acetylase OafA/YrhL
MRAFAVIAVAVYHLFPGALPGGFIGVDVFFVISGFLITSLLLEERAGSGRIGLRRFWIRRARRLIPALVALLLICSAFAFLVGGDVLVGIARQLIGASTFSYNWVAIASGSDYFGSDVELFRNLWSLAVEEQFYLVWPLLLLVVVMIRAKWMRVGVLLAGAAGSAIAMALLFSPGDDATRVYYGTDTHLFGLAIGAALAIGMAKNPAYGQYPPGLTRRLLNGSLVPLAGVLALAIIVTGAFLLGDESATTYRGGLAVIAAATAVLIWSASRSWLGRVLDIAPLRWVGIRSYGLYLWHWPVFVLLGAVALRYDLMLEQWMIGVAAAALTVLFAALSFALVERPVRRDGFRGSARRVGAAFNRSRPRAAAVTAAVALVTVAAVVGTVLAIQNAPSAGSAQRYVAAGQAAVDDSDPSAEAEAARPAPPLASAVNAMPGAPKGPPQIQYPGGDQITGIGDSVMLASAKALQERFPGIALDATVSRSISSAPELVQAQVDAGTLRPILLLGLGTNGAIGPGVLDRVLEIIGPSRQLVLLTVQAPRSWIAPNNAMIKSFAEANPRNVTLADWEAAIAPRLQLLAADKVHPGPTGAGVYAETFGTALNQVVERQQRVAEAEYAAKVERGKQRTRVIQLLALPPCPAASMRGGVLCS